jgi:hypothetical protein
LAAQQQFASVSAGDANQDTLYGGAEGYVGLGKFFEQVKSSNFL